MAIYFELSSIFRLRREWKVIFGGMNREVVPIYWEWERERDVEKWCYKVHFDLYMENCLIRKFSGSKEMKLIHEWIILRMISILRSIIPPQEICKVSIFSLSSSLSFSRLTSNGGETFFFASDLLVWENKHVSWAIVYDPWFNIILEFQ